MADKVVVAVRSRPLSSSEKSRGCDDILEFTDDSGTLTLAGDERYPRFTYNFDYAYGPKFGQVDVYRDVGSPLLRKVMDGFNCTLFAYGQTGSGKTHTMMGPDTAHAFEDVANNGPDAGVIPRLTADLLKQAKRLQSSSGSSPGVEIDVQVTLSYLEIYNEDIHDLLNPGTKASSLVIRESPEDGIYVDKLAQLVVKDSEDVGRLVKQGNAIRHVAATQMNERSSRSHSVLTLLVQQQKKQLLDDGKTTRQSTLSAKLNLVDLAGSERQSKTGATGSTLKEAAKINLSLMELGNVIMALSNEKKKGSIGPSYRNSQLTRLLQESLGGNASTVMLAAVSPADYNRDETKSTLDYAKRAKSITNKVVKNEDVMDKVVRELQEEIDRLKKQLEGDGGAKSDATADGAAAEALEKERAEEAKSRAELAEKMEAMRQAQQQTWEERMQERERLTAELEKERQANIGRALGDIIGDVVERKKAIQLKIRDLQGKKAKATQKLRTAEKKIGTGEKELKDAMNEYQAMQVKRDEAVASGDQVESDKVSKKMEAALYLLNLQGDELKAYKESVFRYKSEVEKLTAEVQSAKVERDASATMLQENDRIRKRIQEEERKKWAEENKDLIKQQEDRFKEERDRAQSEAEKASFDAKEKVRKLEADLAEARQENGMLLKQVERLESAEEISKLESDGLETERDDCLEQIQALETDVMVLKSQLGEAEVGVERIREPLLNEIAELKKQIEETQQALVEGSKAAEADDDDDDDDDSSLEGDAANTRRKKGGAAEIDASLFDEVKATDVSPELHRAATEKLGQITDHFSREEAALRDSFRQLHEVQSSKLQDRLAKRKQRKMAQLGAKATKEEAAKLQKELQAQEDAAKKEMDDQLRQEQREKLEAHHLEQKRHEEDVMNVLKQHEVSHSKLEASLEMSGKEKKKLLQERLKQRRRKGKASVSEGGAVLDEDGHGEYLDSEEVDGSGDLTIGKIADEILAEEAHALEDLRGKFSVLSPIAESPALLDGTDADALELDAALLKKLEASKVAAKVQEAAKEKLREISMHFANEEQALRRSIEDQRKMQTSKLEQRLAKKRKRKQASESWAQASEEERAKLEAELEAAEAEQYESLNKRLEDEVAKKVSVQRIEKQRHVSEVMAALKESGDGEAQQDTLADLNRQQIITGGRGSRKIAANMRRALKAIANDAAARQASAQASTPETSSLEEHGYHIFRQMVEVLEQDRADMDAQLAQTRHLLRQATADLLLYVRRSAILEQSMSKNGRESIAAEMQKVQDSHDQVISSLERDEQKRRGELAAAERQRALVSAADGSASGGGAGYGGFADQKSFRSRIQYLIKTSRQFKSQSSDIHPEGEDGIS